MHHNHPTVVSTRDYYRLQALMCTAICPRAPIAELVRHKLRSAVVMLPADISPDVVTPGRGVQFTIDGYRSEVRALTWETPDGGVRSELSLLLPRGLALLGLTAGQSISYRTATRRTECIEIDFVSPDGDAAQELQLSRSARAVLERAVLGADDAADGRISESQKEHLGNSGNDFRMLTKKTFRLIPAPPGPHWSLVRNWGEVSVTARTSGEARAIAAAQEGLKLEGNVRSNYRASAFLDPKLYSVREVRSNQL